MAEPSEPRLKESLNDALGITGFERPSDELARAEMPVEAPILQPFGIVHGGAYAALAETVTSRATYEAVGPDLGAFGQSNNCSFLRSVSAGVVRAEARARHRGRTTWIWDVEMRDDEGRLCALSRVAIAVRPLRPDQRE
jgi:1,4-dihydroxy-2-naphthoyl-CoA hydrolase